MKLGVVGYTGRFGSALVARVAGSAHSVTWKRNRSGPQDAIELPEVLIDLSSDSALEDSLQFSKRQRIPLVLATSQSQRRAALVLAKAPPENLVVLAPNLSLVHFAFRDVVSHLGEVLGLLQLPCEISVLDRHPSTKTDRPSATGTLLHEMLRRLPVASRVDVESVRRGPRVSTHDVLVTFQQGETLKIQHDVLDIGGAVDGVFVVLAWLARQSPGRCGVVTVDQVFREQMAHGTHPEWSRGAASLAARSS